MSEFTNNKDKRMKKLLEVAHLTLKTGNARSFILENEDFIPQVTPTDFITLFDELVNEGYSMEDLKTCSNKVLNILYTPIAEYKGLQPEPNSFLDILDQNNKRMEQQLDSIGHAFKAFLKLPDDNMIKLELTKHFEEIEKFINYYVIKENILFPVIEKTWSDYRCIQIMWSFHDDIRQNIKIILHSLRNRITDMGDFKRAVGDIFFDMMTIKFRDEKILTPYLLETIDEQQLDNMNKEGLELGFPYIQPKDIQTASYLQKSTNETLSNKSDAMNLGTGQLNVEEIRLIFNHLPVDITYVDENDKVKYFSTPKKRIFPRTTSIIGREVKNCHPQESVHVVEKIVESFKNGEQSQASFWIKMRGEYILIQYFAVRDENNNYRGVIEVTQEITDIKNIEGEKRLLDW